MNLRARITKLAYSWSTLADYLCPFCGKGDETVQSEARAAHDLLRKMPPLPIKKIVKPGLTGATKARRAARKQAQREKTAAVREVVAKRARRECENCNAVETSTLPLQMDHFAGGSRKRAQESEAGCWMLCLYCHRAKTDNVPSAEYWREKFAEHLWRHGYQTTTAREGPGGLTEER